MECNYLPKSESTYLCLPIEDRSRNGDNFSHGNVVKVLGLAVILLSSAVTYLFIQTHHLNQRLDSLQLDDRAAYQSYLQNKVNDEWKLQSYLEEKAFDTEGNFGERREKRNSRRRLMNEVAVLKGLVDELINTTIPNLEAGIMKKAVHLGMSSSMTQDRLQTPVNGIAGCTFPYCLRWAAPESIYSSTFDYEKDLAYDMVVAVKVRSPGLYFLYSQVAVNGPRTGFEPSVGFETVLVRGTTEKSLIKSYITQDNRGAEYGGYSGSQHPFDTINQMGMFKLLCDDYIVIRPIGSPKLVFANHEASYFGVIQINPARALLSGNHGCNV